MFFQVWIPRWWTIPTLTSWVFWGLCLWHLDFWHLFQIFKFMCNPHKHIQREREGGESSKLRCGFVSLMNLQWDSTDSPFTYVYNKHHLLTPPTTTSSCLSQHYVLFRNKSCSETLQYPLSRHTNFTTIFTCIPNSESGISKQIIFTLFVITVTFQTTQPTSFFIFPLALVLWLINPIQHSRIPLHFTSLWRVGWDLLWFGTMDPTYLHVLKDRKILLDSGIHRRNFRMRRTDWDSSTTVTPQHNLVCPVIQAW